MLCTHTRFASATVKLPSGTSAHHVQCTLSKLYTKSRLLDGQNAGRFTDVGKVKKVHRCSRLCCEEPSCDVAYMVGRSCFLVQCNNERGCRAVPNMGPTQESTGPATSVQFLVKRKFGVTLDERKFYKTHFYSRVNWLKRFCS